MKKLMKSLAFIAVAAMSLTSCQNDIDEQVNVNQEGVTLEIIADAPTRSAFGELSDGKFPSTWSGTETAIFVANAGTAVTTTPDEAGTSTRFEVTFTDGTDTENGTIYAMSPKGDYKTEQGGWGTFYSSYGYAYITVPSVQTPLAGSVDESAHILYAEHNYTGAFPTSSANVTFQHVLAYGRMTLTLPEGVVAETVSLTFPEEVAGPSLKYYHTAYGDYEKGDIINASTATITLNADNVENGVYWFTIKPIDMLTGDIELTVTTTDGETLAKTLATNDEFGFQQGKVTGFKVNMSEVEASSVATIDFTAQGWSNGYAAPTTNDDNDLFAASFDKGSNNNAPKYYSNSVTIPAIRLYGNNSMTISSLGSNQIDKIVFTYGSGDDDYTNTISADCGSFDTNTWTATADLTTNVTFTISGTSGQRRISKVDIYYSVADIPFSMSAEDVSIAYNATESVADVTIEGGNNWNITASSNAEWLTVESALNESNQVVYTATENTGEARTATITLTASKEGKSDITTSFTITQAQGVVELSLAEFLEKDVDDAVYYRISGTITDVVNTTFGNFTITDENDSSVYVYGLYDSTGNTDKYWASAGCKEGDYITIVATVGEYNSEKQAALARYISHYGLSATTPETASYEAGEVSFTVTTPEGITGTLDATSSNEFVNDWYINGNTVTVCLSENTDITSRSATVKVTYGNAYINVTINQAGTPSDSEIITESMSIFANKGTLANKVITWTSTNFTVSNAQASSPSAIRTIDTDHFRCYAKSELTIAALNGCTLSQVVVTCTSSSYASALMNHFKNSDYTASVSGSVVTVTCSNVESITITHAAQVRINNVEVTLVK